MKAKMKRELETRDWQVGDATMPYRRSNGPTTIVAMDGDTVTLADGTTMHRRHLLTPPAQHVVEFITAPRGTAGDERPCGQCSACIAMGLGPAR